jgi:hypothetical protein
MEQVFSFACSLLGSFCGEKILSFCLILLVFFLCVISNFFGKNDLNYTENFQVKMHSLATKAILKHRESLTQDSPHLRVRDLVESIQILDILILFSDSNNEKLKKITQIDDPAKLKSEWQSELEILLSHITESEHKFNFVYKKLLQ